jgi:hypothetical protein
MENPFDITDPFAEPEDDQPPVDAAPVNRSRSAGKNSAEDQGTNIPMGWKPTVKEPVPVVRCTGTVRNGPRTGLRCPNWSLRGATVCLQHGGHLPNVRQHAQDVVEAARLRILGLADLAIDTLEELIDPSVGAAIRLKAATELLDRGGIKGAPDLTVEVEHKISASEEINKRLATIANRLAPPKEPEDLGEVVDEPSE